MHTNGVFVHGNRQGMATSDSGCLTFVEKSPVGEAYKLAVLETPTKISEKFTKNASGHKKPENRVVRETEASYG